MILFFVFFNDPRAYNPHYMARKFNFPSDDAQIKLPKIPNHIMDPLIPINRNY
jgi:hypothetical protein